MKTQINKWLAIATVAMTASIGANAQFSVDGQLISRGEYRHGFRALADSNQVGAGFVEQRTRMIFGYKTEKYKAAVSFQDIRTWGSTAQMNKTDGFTSLHEGWGEWICSPKFSVKAGRQELVYDDHRILGNVEWAMEARSHDAALIKFAPDTLTSIHFGAAWNQDAVQSTSTFYSIGSAANGFGNYKAMQYLWANRRFGSSMNLSLLFLNNGLQYSYVNDSLVTLNNVQFSQTAGARLAYKKEALGFFFNGYYQMGNDGRYKQHDNQTAKTLSAFEVAAEVAYTIQKKYTVMIGGEMLSGNSQTDTTNAYKDVNHAFNPFYGTNHKFNGYMDYFYVGNHAGSVGLINPYLKLRYGSEKHIAQVDVHYFMAAADILDQDELAKTGNIKAMNAALGTEIDLTYQYIVSKQLSLQFGYSHMLGTESMEAIRGGKKDETSNWAYLMLSFKPSMFKQ